MSDHQATDVGAQVSAAGPFTRREGPPGGQDVREATDVGAQDCASGEPFALMVLGHSMTPEFNEGEVIVVEPEGVVRDSCYVVAWAQGGWVFRQLLQREQGWWLHALNPAFADTDQPLPDLAAVRGVVIQKSVPGRRELSKNYLA